MGQKGNQTVESNPADLLLLHLLFVYTQKGMTSCLRALGGYRRAWSVADLFLTAMSSASDWRSLGRFVVYAQVFGVPYHTGRVALLLVSIQI